MSDDLIGSDPVLLSDPAVLLENGIVAEINRRILHPLGLALGVGSKTTEVFDGPDVVELDLQVWDYRDDPEGIYFAGDSVELLPLRQAAFATLWNERAPARSAALDYVVQPIDPGPPVPLIGDNGW